MAWRPSEYLIEGELDNRTRGRVTGWMRFVGLREKVTFELKGDFHRDIRGTLIRLTNPKHAEEASEAERYMQGFWSLQKGSAGDITAGLEPRDYVDYPYIEFYSEANGRVVIELAHGQVEVIGTPRPCQNEKPVSRKEQAAQMHEYLAALSCAVKAPVTAARFSPGDLVITAGVSASINPGEVISAFCRHLSGDWGELDPHDRAQNDRALEFGGRLFSAYRSKDGKTRFWVITEADRSKTTVLLPEEY
jgi:hypothetical protein